VDFTPTGGISVQLSKGLEFGTDGISIKLGTGLCFDANGVIISSGGGSVAADNITEGSGTVNIATTGGHIVIHNKHSNSDIIFKGTNSAGTCTALRLDMSEGGTAEFSKNISLISDDSGLSFGTNSEVTLTHAHDSGLKLQHTGGGVSLVLQSGAQEVDAGDVVGTLAFQAPNESDGGVATDICGSIVNQATGSFKASGAPTKMIFNVATGTSLETAMTLKEDKTTLFGLSIEVPGDIRITGRSDLRFYEGSNYVGFKAPDLTSDQIWVLPQTEGTADQRLITDGNGNLKWGSSGGVTSITNGNGISLSASTGAVTIGVSGGGGICVSASGVSVALGTGMSFNSDNQIVVSKPYGARYLDSVEIGGTSILVPAGDKVPYNENGETLHLRHVGFNTSADSLEITKAGMYLVNVYFGMSNTAIGGLSVSLMRYDKESSAIATTGTKELTAFYYGYDTLRLSGIVQATQALINASTDNPKRLHYNVVNHGPSVLHIGNIGTSGADNRFEMIYMGEAV